MHALFHNIQNLTCDGWQVQFAGLGDGQPVQVQQFARRAARVFGVGVNMRVIHHEKAGVEAARAIGRCHGAGDEIHMRQRRHNAMPEISVPFAIAAGRACVRGLAQNKPGLFKCFTNGGQRQSAQAVIGHARAGFLTQARQHIRAQICVTSQPRIGRVAPTTGENKLIGHEFVAGGAFAQ